MNDFGEKLKKLRTNAGLSQKQLAKKLFVTKGAISNYEVGERTPTIETLIQIAETFHVSTDYLLGVEHPRTVLDVEGLTNEEILFLEMGIQLLRKK